MGTTDLEEEIGTEHIYDSVHNGVEAFLAETDNE
jgi:hypothetical protein